MIDPNETVDVMHPTLGLITIPAFAAQQAGVPASMIVPREQSFRPTSGVNDAPPPTPLPYPNGQQFRPTSGVQQLGAPAPSGVPGSAASPSSPTGGEVATPAPRTAASQVPSQADVDAAAPSPGDKPVTAADLSGGGYAAALNQNDAALDKAKAAGTKAAQIESERHTAAGQAYADEQQRQDQIAEARAKFNAENLQAMNQKAASIDASIAAFGKMKTDPRSDHPIINALGILLGSIGQGMIHGDKNPAMEAYNQAIDRKVQAQMADRNAAGQAIGFQRDSLNQMRQHVTDRNAEFDALKSAAHQRSQNILAQISEGSDSQLVKANALKLNAELDQKKAEARGSAVHLQITKDQADRAFKEEQRRSRVSEGIAGGQLSLARAGLAEQIREHDLQRQDKLDELGLHYAQLGQKDTAAKAKALAGSGVFDPTTGNEVLDDKGQAKVDQAANLEAAARKAPPDQAARYRQQAQALRDDATVNNSFTIEDKETRRDVVKKVGSGQDILNTIGKIKDTLASDPGMTDRATWAALETDFERAKTAWIEAHGAKPSSREMQAVEEMFGAGPGAVATRALGLGKMKARLEALEQGAISETNVALRANGYKGSWKPQKMEAPAPAELSGQTSVEAFEANRPGFATKHLAFTNPENRAINAEANADVGPTGLAKQDDATIIGLARSARTVGDAQRENIVSKLALYAGSPRETVASGVLSRIRAEDPDLYKDVVAALPAERQQSVTARDQASGEAVTAHAFATGSPRELAAQVKTDPALRAYVAKKATGGTPEEKRRAGEILVRFR